MTTMPLTEKELNDIPATRNRIRSLGNAIRGGATLGLSGVTGHAELGESMGWHRELDCQPKPITLLGCQMSAILR